TLLTRSDPRRTRRLVGRREQAFGTASVELGARHAGVQPGAIDAGEDREAPVPRHEFAVGVPDRETVADPVQRPLEALEPSLRRGALAIAPAAIAQQNRPRTGRDRQLKPGERREQP